jgi:predicted nuclease with TOPRIM domain
MNDEKIVTIHIDEYLELKNKIEELKLERTYYKNQASYLLDEVAKLETKLNKKRKWYHLF